MAWVARVEDLVALLLAEDQKAPVAATGEVEMHDIIGVEVGDYGRVYIVVGVPD